jgi:hypothetical protein
MQIGGDIIVDSSDILTELGRRWPESPLLPGGLELQGKRKRLEDWAELVFIG